jgi:hypothetical protein
MVTFGRPALSNALYQHRRSTALIQGRPLRVNIKSPAVRIKENNEKLKGDSSKELKPRTGTKSSNNSP